MNLSVLSGDTEYIARISHGKDSRKMLDVIVSRGLPLDRITTTDIWATDTIRGEHPKMVEFGYRMDENIWREYHIEVEHLCAMRNGEKVTYEKMFYHVPKRRIKNAGGRRLRCCLWLVYLEKGLSGRDNREVVQLEPQKHLMDMHKQYHLGGMET